jgi:hypothetical protein
MDTALSALRADRVETKVRVSGCAQMLFMNFKVDLSRLRHVKDVSTGPVVDVRLP